jgi:ethanolamine utilization protein EutQ (cupin superfamily)
MLDVHVNQSSIRQASRMTEITIEIMKQVVYTKKKKEIRWTHPKVQHPASLIITIQELSPVTFRQRLEGKETL